MLLFYDPPSSGIASCVGTAGTVTLDAALLCSSRAGSDLGRTSDWLRSFVNWVSSFLSRASMFLQGEREGRAVEDPSLQFRYKFVRGVRYIDSFITNYLTSIHPLNYHKVLSPP